jgi:hypothetical protein
MMDRFVASPFHEGNGSDAALWADANSAQTNSSARLTIHCALPFMTLSIAEIQDIEQLLSRKSLRFGIFATQGSAGLHV